MSARSVYRQCRKVVLVLMAWVPKIRPDRALEWVWRGLVRLWYCVTTRLRPLVAHALAAIAWSDDSGKNRGQPEICAEEEHPTHRGSTVKAVVSEWEGQQEAVAQERAGEPPREGDDDEGDFDGDMYRVDTSDELHCGYDSTWEVEEAEEVRRSSFRPNRRPRHFGRFENAARDMQNYRHDYPSQNRDQYRRNRGNDDKPNLMFYLGLTKALPDGIYISNFHNDWFGEYDTLEYVHTYIQWLFPLQEPGVNYEATPLTKEEVKEFRDNKQAKENLLLSYKLMLDFYGIRLCDEKTGEVKRSSKWRDRFDNLNNHTHNNLRITRILKCLGHLGFPHYQAPLVFFFLEETLIHRNLPNVKESVLNYFVFAVLNKMERRRLLRYAYMNYDNKDEFVWCPRKIQMIWSEESGHRGRAQCDWL